MLKDLAGESMERTVATARQGQQHRKRRQNRPQNFQGNYIL